MHHLQETISDLQTKLELNENELRSKSDLVADLECKASSAHKLLAEAVVQVKDLQKRHEEHDQHLKDAEEREQAVKLELDEAIRERATQEEALKKLEEELKSEKEAR